MDLQGLDPGLVARRIPAAPAPGPGPDAHFKMPAKRAPAKLILQSHLNGFITFSVIYQAARSPLCTSKHVQATLDGSAGSGRAPASPKFSNLPPQACFSGVFRKTDSSVLAACLWSLADLAWMDIGARALFVGKTPRPNLIHDPTA